MNEDQYFKENLNSILEALKCQYLPTDEETREKAQIYLEEKTSEEVFWKAISQIVVNPELDYDLKKSAVVCVETIVKNRSLQPNIGSAESARIIQTYVQLLTSDGIDMRIRTLLPKILEIVASNLCGGYDNGADTKGWEYYLLQFTAKYNSLDLNTPQSYIQSLGLLLAIQYFIQGLENLANNDAKIIYDFIVVVFPKIQSLLSAGIVGHHHELTIWESVKSYYELIYSYLQLLDDEDQSSLIIQIFKEEEFDKILRHCPQFAASANKLGTESLIFAHDDGNLQRNVSELIEKCFKSLLQLHSFVINTTSDDDIEIDILSGSSKQILFKDFYQASVNSLINLSGYGLDAVQESLKFESTKSLLTNMLIFIERMIKLKAMWPVITENSRELYVKGLIPLLYTNIEEFNLMNDDPEEFVSYAEDLITTQVFLIIIH